MKPQISSPVLTVARLLCICIWATIVAPSGAQTPRTGSGSFADISQRAAAAREKDDIPAAIRYYHEALRLKPTWQDGWWYYGSLLYDDSQYAEAARALRRLAALNAKLGGAWALLGLSEFENRDLARALADLERAKRLGFGDNPSLADVADYHLALLLNLHGDSDRARALLSSLLLRGVNSEDIQVGLGLSLLRVPVLPSQLDPSRDDLVHDAGNVAALLARRQYDQADAAFRQLVSKYPSTHFAHYAYGAMLASRGQEDLAKAEFETEIALTPDSALPYMEWAFIESKASNYHEALPLAQKAVELSPDSFLAHYLLGNALLATGSVQLSVAELEMARKYNPDSPEVRYSLGRAYAKAGKPLLARREQEKFTQLQAARQKSPAGADATLPSEPQTTNGSATSSPPQ